MSIESKNKNWLMLLQRWLSGEAQHQDERSLDAMAQKDPFLADALEGYRGLLESGYAASVTRIKSNLRRRTRKQRGAGFYLLRVAAIGAVLVAAWFVFRSFSAPQNAESIAIHSKENQPGMPETAMIEAPPANREEESATATQEDKNALQPDFSKRATPSGFFKEEQPTRSGSKETAEAAVADNRMDADEVTVITLNDATKPSPQETVVLHEETKALQDAVTEVEPPAEARKKTGEKVQTAPAADISRGNKPLFRRITGVVTDDNGDPLIGATVVVKGTSTGTMTDVDGRYSMEIPEGAGALVFNYTGFSSAEINVRTEERLDVQLNSSNEQLSEVVVTGLGKGKTRRVATPKPAGGFKKFEKYLRENLRYPAEAAQAGVKGTVTVRFWIQADGTPSGFDFVSSLGYGCDEEAIRLLKEGPKWNADPGSQATYSIIFK